jgi:hypothetical protein
MPEWILALSLTTSGRFEARQLDRESVQPAPAPVKQSRSVHLPKSVTWRDAPIRPDVSSSQRRSHEMEIAGRPADLKIDRTRQP